MSLVTYVGCQVINIIFFSADIDECLVNNGGCAHFCTNTIGSFECSCYQGHQLAEDGFTCFGMYMCEFFFQSTVNPSIFLILNLYSSKVYMYTLISSAIIGFMHCFL